MHAVVLIVVLFLTLVANADDLALQEIVNANNRFASSLYKTIHLSSNRNFAISPFSAGAAFALIQSGCKGRTADEIRTALHLPNNKNAIEAGFKTLLPTLKGNGFYTFHFVTKVYGKKNLPFKKTFKTVAKQVYLATTESIDFSKRAKAAKTINKWVEKNTKNKIKNMVSASSFGSGTGMVVLNAFYLQANWSNPFPPLSARTLFYKNLDNEIFVDTLLQNEAHLYNLYESVELNARFLELPFQGGEVSMVIALPNAKNGLGNLENQIEKVLEPQPFVVENVVVVVPKFKTETRGYLKNILQAMGVNAPFEKKTADLSDAAGKKGSLFVNNVLQKVYFKVEEGGIDAASSTATNTERSASPAAFLPTKEFIADHPFIYYVKVKDLIVCIGRVLDPTQQ